MNLYIRVKNDQPVGHPALEENLISTFGCIPSDWEVFTRVEQPVLVYEVLASHSYEKIDGVWKDVWRLKSITEEEKLAKQQAVKDQWSTAWGDDQYNFTTWVFDEETCSHKPPVPMPLEPGLFWQGSSNSWVACPVYPDDGKRYKLDYASATWVEIT